jgi:hypothetical protein
MDQVHEIGCFHTVKAIVLQKGVAQDQKVPKPKRIWIFFGNIHPIVHSDPTIIFV